MTGLSIVIIALALIAVFAMFWRLVEWTGGAAGAALSVCRSMQTGFDAWRESQEVARATSVGTDQSPTPDPDDEAGDRRLDPGLEVPVQAMQGRPFRRRP
jgi:hypothetical protein